MLVTSTWAQPDLEMMWCASVRIPRSVFGLFAALIVGLSFEVPRQDLLDTGYDESESLPYEVAPSHTRNLIDPQECRYNPIRTFTTLLFHASVSRPGGTSTGVQRGIQGPVLESRAISYVELRC